MTKKLVCLFLTIFLSGCLTYEPYDSIFSQKEDLITLITEADVTHTPNLNQYIYIFLVLDETEKVLDEKKRQEILEKNRMSSSSPIEDKNALYFGKEVFQNMGYTVLDEAQIRSTEDCYCVVVTIYWQSTLKYRAIMAYIYKIEKGHFAPETMVWWGGAANILSSEYQANPKYYWTKLFSYYGRPSFEGEVAW